MNKYLILVLVLPVLVFSLTASAQDDRIKAAGVLPYTVINDTTYLLLGYDDDKPGWTDFGGSKEWIASLDSPKLRPERPEEIAVREFFEECRMVYDYQQIQYLFDKGNYITATSSVYRSYVVRVPYKPRSELRSAMIPVDERFSIFNEKSDYYWIPLEELITVIAGGSNHLPNSPNEGVIYSEFYKTLVAEVSAGRFRRYFGK